MKVNTKIRYGLRTMMELGCPENKKGILQKDIAINQELSEKYLDPIISALKVAGLISNVGGKKSGYILSKSKSKVKILDIFKAFEHGPFIVQCIDNPSVCNRSENCVAREFWTGLNNVIIEYLKNTSLEELCLRCKKQNTPIKKNKIKRVIK
ncbi:MAG: Rrf2 family transcriptional regulator [Bacteroidales bacterium]|jgi:Rrf2 family protein